jgi:excisionase family DNA binding protein
MTVLLTIAEAARRLALSDKGVRRLIDRGDLQAVDIAPSGSARRTLRIEQQTIDRFLKQRLTRDDERRPSKFTAELEYLRSLEAAL